MKNFLFHIGRNIPIVLVLSALVYTDVYSNDSGSKEIGRTTERELNVVLTSSFGNVYLSKGESEKILIGEAITRHEADPGLGLEYSIRNRIGYMELNLGAGEGEPGDSKKRGIHFADFRGGKSYLRFSDAIPISFDVKLGVGRGEFDFSGLQVKDFNLETGASDVHVSFNEPNKSAIEIINIESGVSKFTGDNLGNANFKRFHFQGGVGTYTLDFSGNLRNEVDVDIGVGLGVMTIYIPHTVGAKIQHEKNWVSQLSTDRDFKETREGEFTSENYNSATARMNIRIESGLGSVKVRRK